MKARIFTGILITPLSLWLIYTGELPFFIFVACLGVIVVLECAIIIYKRLSIQGILAAILTAASLTTSYLPQFQAFWGSLFIKTALIVLTITALLELKTHRIFLLDSQMLSLLRISILISLTIPFSYLVRDKSDGLFYFLFLCILTWLSDSFAYFIGKAIGKRKLSTISPNKTVEGSLGGFLVALFFSIGMISVFSLPVVKTLLISSLFILLSQIGDLHESLFKRNFRVKDSSKLLPGHGGIYDRCDSYIFAMPFAYFFS